MIYFYAILREILWKQALKSALPVAAMSSGLQLFYTNAGILHIIKSYQALGYEKVADSSIRLGETDYPLSVNAKKEYTAGEYDLYRW